MLLHQIAQRLLTDDGIQHVLDDAFWVFHRGLGKLEQQPGLARYLPQVR
jgi:hypothetical protein